MMSNQVPKNEKPQDRVATQSQGEKENRYSNSTTLRESKSRHDKGMELYKTGKVSIGANGLFKVSGYYEADTERMTCTCPDYRTRKEACKHLFAAMLFVKNRGRKTIEDLPGHTWVDEIRETPVSELKNEPKEAPNKPTETPSKPFDRQATITRLAVLNTATEILKTHGKPITSEVLFQVAAQLEKWALGGDEK